VTPVGESPEHIAKQFSSPTTQSCVVHIKSAWQSPAHCIDCAQQFPSTHALHVGSLGLTTESAAPQVAASVAAPRAAESSPPDVLESGATGSPTVPPMGAGGAHVTFGEGVQFPSSGGCFGSRDEHAANHTTKAIPTALMDRLVSL
jgi:hypothetical protein